MTKEYLRRAHAYYGQKLFDSAMEGSLSAVKFTRLDRKLNEWGAQLERVSLRNGSAIRYVADAK